MSEQVSLALLVEGYSSIDLEHLTGCLYSWDYVLLSLFLSDPINFRSDFGPEIEAEHPQLSDLLSSLSYLSNSYISEKSVWDHYLAATQNPFHTILTQMV